MESGRIALCHRSSRPLKILALETSTELCSAALWSDGAVDAREAIAGQRHSELLLPMVEGLLAGHGLKVTGLDGVAFGAGPGSFTGLRIACGAAQGIAFGGGLPVVGVATLLALAERSGAARALCCLDARMGEIYHAAYERQDDEWLTVHPPALCRPDAAPALEGSGWTGCGSGFAAHAALLGQRYASQLDSVRPELAPHAREIAVLAACEFARGKGVAPELAAPLYLRDKVALRVDER
jgi:tRNA threonylcarbamoyladenosine biosynthesis protein TsaB